MIHVSDHHRIVGVPVQPSLLNLFPSAKRVTWEGNEMMLLPHGLEETRLLRNMGLEVPAPILSQYDWESGKPFDIQKKTAAMLTMNTRAYVLNGMGTGKTKAALWSWRYLNKSGLAGKLLVVAPLSTLNFTWAKEIFQTLPGVRTQVLHGTKAKRLDRLADPHADVFVINHDGLAVIADELAKRPDIDTFIIDELAVYRNGTATRTKVTRKVVQKMKWAWGMTGSPAPNAPTDAWAQCTLLTPSTVPKYFNRFREEVMYRLTQFKWAPKQDALDKVFDAMQPSVRFTLDDVVELPELIERTIDIDLGPKQERVYKQMEEHAFTAIASHEITAMNAGAVLSKLLQISCGYIYTREGDIVPLDNDERLQALVDIVLSTNEKVIVFAPFKHALAGIAKRLTSESIDVAVISGDTPKGDRDDIFAAFQTTSKYKCIVAHPQTMAHGLTLTAASTIVWFAPITSLETFEQANARVRRIGQKHRQQILMFQATKAEKQMYARLRAKQKVQNLLLDMFSEATA
jgi:SNF2 family DNA or RNA helicase